jgi:metal-responsive CopG/Arc/MetJ family transcriptional regulator
VAKVMISIPDDLLAKLDARAAASKKTRSGYLRWLAEREFGSEEARRRVEVERLLDLATAPMGGDGTKLIREARNSR